MRALLQVVALACAFVAGRYLAPACSKSVPHLSSADPEVDRLSYAPPPNHGKVQVPSVLHDARGSIHNLAIGGFRFNVLVSRAGTARSGDFHPSHQLDMIFSGHVRLTTRQDGRDVVREYGSGSLVVLEPFVPHIFEFLNKTIMAEWWDGAFDARYYRPYRDLVDAATKKLRSP
mmetsp:Transcript_9595/g.20919  ORF Transcript_9595/g.20919 Transcript_9595/m.20919 type:complete len:174 (-) Transcript_9595:304-825(-)|eukprot:CAMPEP_0183341884 /NCGR_PEP_ID=MMETSP0164_2-20130417/8092_1 /TAXON_ID=221442 /ORGANISM="Coccolithus pelagicus ssp braarudi, Strain PLY182g" /LENGTH=173 /DNA_ID=CAMNT_0025512329 /DNA_START=123 /DNA_END=644 /DNA_ORIENTATION=-